jgi:hypothetical protein
MSIDEAAAGRTLLPEPDASTTTEPGEKGHQIDEGVARSESRMLRRCTPCCFVADRTGVLMRTTDSDCRGPTEEKAEGRREGKRRSRGQLTFKNETSKTQI